MVIRRVVSGTSDSFYVNNKLYSKVFPAPRLDRRVRWRASWKQQDFPAIIPTTWWSRGA